MTEQNKLPFHPRDSSLPVFLSYSLNIFWISLSISLLYCLTLLPFINEYIMNITSKSTIENRSFIILIAMEVILPLLIIAAPLYYALFESIGMPIKQRLSSCLKIIATWRFLYCLIALSLIGYLFFALYILGSALFIIFGLMHDITQLKDILNLSGFFFILKLSGFLLWQILFAYLFVFLSLVQYYYVVEKVPFKTAFSSALGCLKYRWLSLLLLPAFLIYPAGLVYLWFINELIPMIHLFLLEEMKLSSLVGLVLSYFGMLCIATVFLHYLLQSFILQ